MVRIKSLVSGCILQGISYLEVISLGFYFHCLQDYRARAWEGGKADMGGSNKNSDWPLTEAPHRLPTLPIHQSNRAKESKIRAGLRAVHSKYP